MQRRWSDHAALSRSPSMNQIPSFVNLQINAPSNASLKAFHLEMAPAERDIVRVVRVEVGVLSPLRPLEHVDDRG